MKYKPKNPNGVRLALESLVRGEMNEKSFKDLLKSENVDIYQNIGIAYEDTKNDWCIAYPYDLKYLYEFLNIDKKERLHIEKPKTVNKSVGIKKALALLKLVKKPTYTLLKLADEYDLWIFDNGVFKKTKIELIIEKYSDTKKIGVGMWDDDENMVLFFP